MSIRLPRRYATASAELDTTLTRLGAGDGVVTVKVMTPSDLYLVYDADGSLAEGDAVPSNAAVIPAGVQVVNVRGAGRPYLAAVTGTVVATFLALPVGAVASAGAAAATGGAGPGGGAPEDATYIVRTADVDLPNCRELDVSAGLGLSDGGAGSTLTIELDAGLVSLTGVDTAADLLPYTTAANTWAGSSITSYARTLLDDANAGAARTTLGLVIGTDVQAYDPDLATLAAISGVRGDVLFYGASGWARLPASTAGYALATQGAGADPAWVAVGSLSGFRKFFDTTTTVTGVTLHSSSVEFFLDQVDGGVTSFDLGAAGVSWAVIDRGLRINLPGTAGAAARLCGVILPGGPPTNDFVVCCTILFEGPGISNSTGGLTFHQDLTITGDIRLIGSQAAATTGNVAKVRNFADFDTHSSDATSAIDIEGRLFVAVKYDTSTRELEAWMGGDPHALHLAQAVTLTNAVTQIGFCGQGANSGAGLPARMTVEFVRFFEVPFVASTPPDQLTGAALFAP